MLESLSPKDSRCHRTATRFRIVRMDLNYRSVVALALTLLSALRQTGGQLVYTSSVSLYPPAPISGVGLPYIEVRY